MKAEIIAIGSELTCGARLDTNSRWLSTELEGLGWTVQRHTTIADDRDQLIQAFRDAALRSRIVLVTGGLGPTLDDITRETLADAFGQQLVSDPVSLAQIEAMFRSRGRQMPERNQVQALRPESSRMIPNRHGTAPGILLELNSPPCLFAAMPGVPREMQLMFRDDIIPQLPASSCVVQRRVLRTFGLGESDVEQRLEGLTARNRNPEVGITASNAVISLSITTRAASREECRLLEQPVCEQIQQQLREFIFGEGEEEIHQTVAHLLLRKKLRIALLECSTTGGLLGQWMTQTSEFAGLVAHSQLFPTRDSLGISVDAEVLDALRDRAKNMMKHQYVDFVLASTPSEIVEISGVRHQTGHVLAIGHAFDRSHDVCMTGNLGIFQERAARHALNQLRIHLAKIATQSVGS